jgi:hypothetical protein
MANEITLNLKLQVLKGSLAHLENPGAISVDLSGSTAVGGVQTIGTASAEVLIMNDVTSPGYGFFRNTSSTNFVEIGTGTSPFVPFAKLKAGEAAIMRLSTTTPTAKADSSSVGLQYFILAD